MKDVMILTGIGQIGMAIARRIGCGKKIVIGDKSRKNAEAIAATMEQAGFDVGGAGNGLSAAGFDFGCAGAG